MLAYPLIAARDSLRRRCLAGAMGGENGGDRFGHAWLRSELSLVGQMRQGGSPDTGHWGSQVEVRQG